MLPLAKLAGVTRNLARRSLSARLNTAPASLIFRVGPTDFRHLPFVSYGIAIRDFAYELGGTGRVSEAEQARPPTGAAPGLRLRRPQAPAHDAGGEDLAAYLTQNREAGYAPNTLRKERQMALSFFTWAYETERISAETLIALRSVVSPQGWDGSRPP